MLFLAVGEQFLFFLVGVDLEGDMNAGAVGGGFHDAADGGGGEAVATDQHGDIDLGKDEFEAQSLRPDFGHLELGFGRVVDELDRDGLEKGTQLVSDQLHMGTMYFLSRCRKGNERPDGETSACLQVPQGMWEWDSDLAAF